MKQKIINTIDRDINASINIENEGKRIKYEKVGSWRPDVTLVELPLMESSTTVDDSYITVKQELSEMVSTIF